MVLKLKLLVILLLAVMDTTELVEALYQRILLEPMKGFIHLDG